MSIVDFGLANYYGNVEAFEKDGKFYVSLEDWDDVSEVEISEKLWNALVDEFGLNKE